MFYKFVKAYGPRAEGEIIDVRPEAAEELVKAGVLVCIDPKQPRPVEDRAMQPTPRGRRA